MKDDRKAEIRRHYGEMLDVQSRLRGLAVANRLPVALEPDPDEPSSVDQLSEAMNVVRGNMNLMPAALNAWDREANGCETRTRSVIEEDIERDMRLLARPGSTDRDRPSDEIEGNISYDQMQLRRI